MKKPPPHSHQKIRLNREDDTVADPERHQGLRGRGARLREWLADKRPFGRVLRPRCRSGSGTQPGLVMIKIDGLSYRQLQRAFTAGRLPYVRHLAASDRYILKPLYSGIPSSTPVVQGELFFGVKSSIPAISYFDRQRGKKMTLLLPAAANTMARRLAKHGRPLLEGGRSYSNIYTGGAHEARYCIQTMRLRSVRHIASSVKLFLMLALQPAKPLKILGYGLLEGALAFYDLCRGVNEGKSVFKELKFVPTRVLVSSLLRDLIRTRVKIDLARGVPIVHASFLGYDEQAHRRGPGSAFAHWCLKGIDDAIRQIHRTAVRSKCRHYRLVVYADHGQEAALAYEKYAGTSLAQAVTRAVHKAGGGNGAIHDGLPEAGGMLARRARSLFGAKPRENRQGSAVDFSTEGPRIAAMGPLGHIYLPGSAGAQLRERTAAVLVHDGGIPLVLYLSGETVVALTCRGAFDLEKDAETVLGSDHAFAGQAGEDLAAVCRHPDAGDIVISGWRPRGVPLTFAVENGAHGGPGRDETRAFVLIPEEMDASAVALRPSDLRARVFALFEKSKTGRRKMPRRSRRA